MKTYDAAIRKAEQLRGELVEEHAQHATREELDRWTDDPVGWDLACGREPVDYQIAVMESVRDHKLTAWRACHGAGKEWAIGSLAVWLAYARLMLVLIVSATERQVVGQTMREVRKAWRAARKAHGIGGQLFQGSVRVGGEDRIIALTGSATVDSLTGWHDAANGVAVLISEGQGEQLESSAYDAAMANVTTDRGRILAAGNPVRPEGRFFEVCHRDHWRRFRTSAFDTPNVKAGKVVRPGFPAPDWPASIEREYGGTDSPFYVGRVLAEFPSEAQDALVRREWLDRAHDLHARRALTGPDDYVVGVDPARLGPDATALCIRRGGHVVEFRRWHQLDTMATAERVRGECKRIMGTFGPVHTVYVDPIGIGAGVLDRLAQILPTLLDEPIPMPRRLGRAGDPPPPTTHTAPTAEGFDAGKRAGQPTRFLNARAQAYWRLRRMLEEGKLALPREPELDEELLATRVQFTSDGRVQIGGKEQLRARLGRSPDLADALVISLAGELEDDRLHMWVA